MADLTIAGLRGMPEILPGANLPALIVEAIGRARLEVDDGDVFVVTQKIVSKANGRLVRLDSVEPSAPAIEFGRRAGKDSRLIEVILRESVRIVRMERGVIIAETRHGFVCANAGVDGSNVAAGFVTLLPENPDEDARAIRDALTESLDRHIGVIVSDTFGRPWRLGQVNVAIGSAGVKPLVDYRGCLDASGQRLQSTVIGVADQLASAAELVMGKLSAVPVAILKGAAALLGDGRAADLIRPSDEDMFR